MHNIQRKIAYSWHRISNCSDVMPTTVTFQVTLSNCMLCPLCYVTSAACLLQSQPHNPRRRCRDCVPHALISHQYLHITWDPLPPCACNSQGVKKMYCEYVRIKLWHPCSEVPTWTQQPMHTTCNHSVYQTQSETRIHPDPSSMLGKNCT